MRVTSDVGRAVVTMTLVLCAGAPDARGQSVERQTVLTITAKQMDDGILSEITWDGGALLLQGVVAEPDGQLSARYYVLPADGIELKKLAGQTRESQDYWEMKARRVSPTGLGKIVGSNDVTLPMYGIAGLEQRIADTVSMGGMQEKHALRIGKLVIHERMNNVEPYDGEVWSWSPPELNRVAYVDGNGHLWVARADGTRPRRLLKGKFTLPAWSPDGRSIAIAEQKDGGRKWVISLVHLPPDLRTQ